jgi:cyclic pyranopterin monophosphate synthase
MTAVSHLDEKARARMVDVGDKAETQRHAGAEGWLRCAPATVDIVRRGAVPKGAVIQTAELAGTMGAKRSSDLIPLCPPLMLSNIDV